MLLDAGCGNGRYARKLFEDGFRNICAFDLYEVNLDQIPTKVGSVSSIPYEDDTFDIAYTLSVLYYEEDIERAFLELRRVLKTNGILLFSVFVSSSPSSWLRIFRRSIGWNSRYQLESMHFRSIQHYRRALAKSGFGVIDINGYFFPEYAQLLNYLSHKGINTDAAPSFKLPNNSIFAKLKGMFGYHCLMAARTSR
jgi:SAM-dependent methyltransferase